MLAAYVLGCLALIIKPGPDLTCVLATALAEGRRRAAVLTCGLVLGCWLWILLLALGVASFFVSHPLVMTAIQVVGVCYIAHLAAQSLREAVRGFRAGGSDELRSATSRGWALVWRGVAMSMSNPLTIIFFLAFLPNFTREGASLPPAVQTLLLGALFCFLVPWVYLPIILAAGAFRSRLVGNPRFSAGLKLVSGLMLAAVALVLALQIRF